VSSRHRLPLAPLKPPRALAPRATSPVPQVETDRIVLAVIGRDSELRAFVAALVASAQGACAVLDADSFVGGALEPSALQTWLRELPRDAWVIAVGESACARFRPTYTVGLGTRHDMDAAATDLWLGQSSALVAAALVAALRIAFER
jgi:hypothetical protein